MSRFTLHDGPASWPHRLREWRQNFRGNWRQWRADCREDPSRLWRTPAVRIVFYFVLALAILFVALWLAGGLQPRAGDVDTAPPTATLFVACTNPACLKSYTVTLPRAEVKFPLKCDHCDQVTVERATRCPVCREWIAARADACPICRARAAASTEEGKPRHAAPKTGDDAEDGWD